jgi:hypothetical protein
MARTPPDPRPDSATWRDGFERSMREPLAWKMSADALYRAVGLLRATVTGDIERVVRANVGDAAEPSVSFVYLLLAGLALENVAKGLLARAKPNEVVKDGKWRRPSHSLEDLLREAGVALAEDERELVGRLSEAVVWCGKYPNPLSFEDGMPRTLPNGGFAPPGMFTSGDPDRFDALYCRVYGVLDRA